MFFISPILFFLAIFSWAAPRSSVPSVGVKILAKGFERPVSVKFDDQNVPYVVEQGGRVKKVTAQGNFVFLDISDRSSVVSGYSEQGLLDIAFSSDYPKSLLIYAHYTDREGNTVLSSFAVKNGRAVDSGERVLLTAKQPYSNHNGGQIEFGPDGFLYMALGDGGSSGDPRGNAQNLKSLLGKILRLDMKKSSPVPEIWAYGLRNPWRFSFDGGDLYIADVGQHQWEEINVENIREGGGKNYGWNTLEGNSCYRLSSCSKKGMKPPVHVYRNGTAGDCSVTGGYVYRGKLLPQLSGLYFYSDFCSGALRSFKYEKGAALGHREWKELNPSKKRWGRVPSLGRDREGEIYILDYDRGVLLKLSPSLPQ